MRQVLSFGYHFFRIWLALLVKGQSPSETVARLAFIVATAMLGALTDISLQIVLSAPSGELLNASVSGRAVVWGFLFAAYASVTAGVAWCRTPHLRVVHSPGVCLHCDFTEPTTGDRLICVGVWNSSNRSVIGPAVAVEGLEPNGYTGHFALPPLGPPGTTLSEIRPNTRTGHVHIMLLSQRRPNTLYRLLIGGTPYLYAQSYVVTVSVEGKNMRPYVRRLRINASSENPIQQL